MASARCRIAGLPGTLERALKCEDIFQPLFEAYARMTSNRIEDLTFLAGEPETEIPMTSTVGQLAKAQTGWICIRALTRRETVEKKLKDYLREKAGCTTADLVKIFAQHTNGIGREEFCQLLAVVSL